VVRPSVRFVTDAAVVRRVGLALPGAFEQQVGGHWKLKVGRIVFVALSKDEQALGFGFPREERDALIAWAPERFSCRRRGTCGTGGCARGWRP